MEFHLTCLILVFVSLSVITVGLVAYSVYLWMSYDVEKTFSSILQLDDEEFSVLKWNALSRWKAELENFGLHIPPQQQCDPALLEFFLNEFGFKKHVEDTIRHKNFFILAADIYMHDLRVSSSAAFHHDNSKLINSAEIKGYIMKWIHGVEGEHWAAALAHHYRVNPHHPEHYNSVMPRTALKESIVDMAARFFEKTGKYNLYDFVIDAKKFISRYHPQQRQAVINLIESVAILFHMPPEWRSDSNVECLRTVRCFTDSDHKVSVSSLSRVEYSSLITKVDLVIPETYTNEQKWDLYIEYLSGTLGAYDAKRKIIEIGESAGLTPEELPIFD